MANKKGKLKVCIACSTGGHLVEARRLASVYEKYDHFYFTFSGGVANELKKTGRVRVIPNIHRRNPLSWIIGAVLSAYIAIIERPKVVISTGAGIVVFFCIFAKLLGAKFIFIETMAGFRRPTLTARFLYPFADLFFVQWSELIEYFPKSIYGGRLI